MAVKVISTKPDASVVKQIVCRKCGARLEYTPLDVKEYSGRDYSGGPDGCTWVDCPNCGDKAVISSW
jgi:DNA-directed RNA polymerase subunit RPC12/RpoP